MTMELSFSETSSSVLAAIACGGVALIILVKYCNRQQGEVAISKARSRRDASFQQAEEAIHQFSTTKPDADLSGILSLSLAKLTERLHKGSLNPEEVLHAYMKKALEVNKKLNCATEILLESCQQVSNLESCRDGLLYGVPISIKDNVGYKGHDSTCGLVCKVDQPDEDDCVLVKVLKSQGAVPFIKTNIPQGLLNYDCSNPLFGQCRNPHNLQKTPGGSSGGEGSLIGGGGSILGIGTDIGGSIRIPSAFCGICGLKPTANRLSLRGLSAAVRGQKSVSSAIGPMARDVDSLALCMRALLCEEMFTLDPTVPPIPFNDQVYLSTEPLRIGYCEDDGYLKPSPSMARTLRETKEMLERAGHTLVPFTPPRIFYTMHELIVRGILADGTETLLSKLEGGPVDKCLTAQIIPYRLPIWVKTMLSVVLKPIFPRIAASLSAICGVRSVADLWRQHVRVEDYTHEFIAEWRKMKMDVLLCPMLGPAYNFQYCGKLTSALSYTILYNLLNFPVGVVPVSTVTPDDEAQLDNYKGNFGDPWDKLFVKAVRGGVGLPMAVECVALPYQEELCLRFMREVEQLVKDNRK
ncbi:fatty-acid amide hydrolase 1 isoform X2 [Engraulis encrasicolus]|uniref:fatty-acid amide hydrolase 1 isoform X2 n=1 Tax=Engraulis encrasicolus TaxID=184585 RepID=UPI002FD621D1